MVDEKLVSDWVALWFAERNTPERDRLSWAFEAVWDLARESPDTAWEFILAVLKTDPSDKIYETLAAGPLEDLLAKHGPAVIDRVEKEAKENPRFASLLGGVWRSRMTDEIWSRVQAVWDRREWGDS